MSWNSGAERIKGYKAKEIIGKHFSVFYNREAIRNNFPQFELKKALENGHFEDEGWRIRKDGTAFWANVVLTPIYNQEQRLLGFAKVTRDLTERRRNEELQQRNQDLVRINNELDNFVYTASHDLKSPISNLQGLLTALKEDLGTESQNHNEVLFRMDGAIRTLQNVISDLADVARLQQKEQQQEKVSIPALLQDVRESLQNNIQESGTEIKADFSGFEQLYYSRNNLRSILYNLVSNAIKYADPNRRPIIQIKTAISKKGEYVLSVTDNGLGIPEHQKDKIFAMFRRAHDHVQGSGVGLYLVKKILDNAGEKITVDSKLGEGSKFKIYFKQGGPGL